MSFGATTGRPRRCGWLDVHALQRVVEMNSLTGLCITKLDVLDGLKEIALCTDYEVDASGNTTPVYEMMPGWATPTESVKSFSELPENARAYLARIEALCGIPIDVISTGPGPIRKPLLSAR